MDPGARAAGGHLYNTAAEANAGGNPVQPGTDEPRSIVMVPIVAGDRRLGGIGNENHEREYAFGDSEIRLLKDRSGQAWVWRWRRASCSPTTQRRARESAALAQVGAATFRRRSICRP